jgi:rsbT co-antagonist protein RsbR
MADASPSTIDIATWQSYELLQNAVDALGDPFFAKDLQHRWVVCNQAFCAMLGRSLAELLGRSDPDFVPAEQAEVFWRGDDAVTSTGEPQASEETITPPDGATRYIWTRKWPMRDRHGRITGLCATITDITEIRRRQEQVQRLEAEIKEQMTIIEAQGALLDELSVPVIQVWDNVLLLPLIGIIESRRAARVLETLLDAVGRMGAEFVVIDITGVPVVDTAVASYLLRAVQATQLLGCQSILVGISPEIAQTLVGLGVDFGRITTRATLQNGLEHAFKRIDEAKRRLATGR